MAASTKTEDKQTKAAPKATKAESPKSAPKAAAPKVEAPEATEPVTAPAAEQTATQEPEANTTDSSTESKESDEAQGDFIHGLQGFFNELFNKQFSFSSEEFDLEEEFNAEPGCCGALPLEEELNEAIFSAGVAEGLRRAVHPSYGIVSTAPAPIQVVDQTTASFGHLVELQKLHQSGILTDAEYAEKKRDILRNIY